MEAIFFTGATGYIGGAVLARILQNNKDYQIAALVRSKEKGEQLAKLGVRPVIGDLNDLKTITEESSKADVVIHTAAADHFPSAKAIIEGLDKKFKDTGKKSIYIHTSGSGIVLSLPGGNEKTEKVYDDANTAELNAVPLTNPHRDLDAYVLEHNTSYNVYVITPTTIYGQSELTLKEISNPVSLQIPLAIKGALKLKKAQQPGKGLNVWSNIHIDDCSDLYLLILQKALKGELTSSEEQGYYFTENGEYAWKDVHKQISTILFKKGIAKDDSVAEVNTTDEVVNAYGFPEAGFFLGTNCRVKASKARKIGWAPKHTDMIGSLEKDIDYLISRQK